ncbi:P-II family nitrogen regulator [Leptospira sp. GIMC2001]|uniref:P-II family nitrogen regulator n=1 Tax=Leptospira sp. GIMC2001 TaxID=1513297 RepID=UPI002349B197|nr:P-II family nitrogen regulator [Leptospira sp. GIMC2001]WCL50845.1 hypothetical protein O4O04_08540 [Leptospira sp. GIMC2001]
MKLEKRKLVTIIIQDTMEKDVIENIKSLGIKGYTISPASGEGISQVRNNAWEGSNVRIETILREETALNLMKLMGELYFDLYGVIVFSQDVEVIRKDKFDS